LVNSGASGALPLLLHFSFSATLFGIGAGTCLTFFWPRPLRDDGIIKRGSVPVSLQVCDTKICYL
jgi:hypothetical protein